MYAYLYGTYCMLCMAIYGFDVHSEGTTRVRCAMASFLKYQSLLYPDVHLAPIWNSYVLVEKETVIPASDWMQRWQIQVVSAPGTPQISPAACNITTPVTVRLRIAFQKPPMPRHGEFCVERHFRRIQSWIYIQRLCTHTSKAKPARSNQSP